LYTLKLLFELSLTARVMFVRQPCDGSQLAFWSN